MANYLDNPLTIPNNNINFIGKHLEQVIITLGNYTTMESIENFYSYTWESKTKILKLAFNSDNICIKILKESKKTKVNWFKGIRNPLMLTLFAGLVSIGVGYSWEYFKFKRQTVFEKKINLIIDSRKQVQDIYVEYDRIIRQVRSYEKEYKRLNMCDPQNLSSQVEEIKLLGLRVRYIQEFSKGVVNNPELKTNIDSFETENLKYIKCLTTNKSCDICTDQYPDLLNYLNKIIELHTSEINSKIN